MEPRQRPSVLGQRGGQKLNRHNLAELQIFRAIDFAHAPAPRERNHAIAVRDDLPGREPAAANGIGAGKKTRRARRTARRPMRWSRRMRRRATRRRWRDGFAFATRLFVNERSAAIKIDACAAARTEPPRRRNLHAARRAEHTRRILSLPLRLADLATMGIPARLARRSHRRELRSLPASLLSHHSAWPRPHWRHAPRRVASTARKRLPGSFRRDS